MNHSGKKITFKARDGYTLGGTLWQSENPKGIVAINPGTAVGQGLYAKFSYWLSQHNFDVLTYDYRGIEASAPSTLKGFQASIIDWAKKDIAGAIDWMTKNYPKQKKYLVGHSMGLSLIHISEPTRPY